jgi:UDP-N-acetylmuramoyl-L-alanyl-D-glutamate--2,6-diaminopimelate ligase
VRLDALLEQLPVARRVGSRIDPGAPVTGAASDSRLAERGQLFFAYPGARSDGLAYLPEAFERGCVAAVVDAHATVSNEYEERCIYVHDLRAWTARAAALACGEPCRDLLVVGVTGTNGKTSSCYLLRALLEAAGHRVLLMTTVSHEFEGWSRETPNTTPDAALIQATLARAKDAGATAAVLEVSAHGVLLDRITGTAFDGLLFTNLSRDHQDFFDGMEPYYREKKRLFAEARFHKPGCVAAVGCDDPFGRRLAGELPLPVLTFGGGGCDVSTDNLVVADSGIRGKLPLPSATLTVDSNLRSAFNRANIAGAAALASQLLPDTASWSGALRSPLHVPGRLNFIEGHGAPFSVVVDFAHTDSALENLLAGLEQCTPGRLIAVFGAGGDKDPLRRYTLPQIVIDRCDLGIITLDNPRSEAPESIIGTMVENWHSLAAGHPSPAALQVEPDRGRAIGLALTAAQPGDTVVLAGKGHETGQLIGNQRFPHDDHAVAAAWLARHYPVAAMDEAARA